MAARQASTMSLSTALFRTYPDAPAFRASNRNCSSSYIDRITTRRAGRRRDSSWATWSPVIFGMFTSSTARSMSPRTPRATASAPSETAATTAKSGWLSSTRRTPCRTISWSSATSTRHPGGGTALGLRRQRRSKLHRQPVLRLGHEQFAADDHRPLTHPSDTAAGMADAAHAVTVIAHGEEEIAAAVDEAHVHACCSGVACDVRQALLGDAVAGHLDIRIEGGQRPVQLPFRLDPPPLRAPPQQRAKRTREAQAIQRARPPLLADA